jgi:hypothetical protein
MGLSVKPIVALLFASGVPVNRHQLHAYTSDRIFGSRSNSSFWKLGRVDEFWRDEVFGIPELNQT